MKYELVELVVHWLCNWVVVGSNLTKNEFNFLFAKISFGMEMKRQKTLATKGGSLVGWETTNYGLWMVTNT